MEHTQNEILTQEVLSMKGSICTAVSSLAETPQPPPPTPHLVSYTGALFVSQDKRHLFVTPCTHQSTLAMEAFAFEPLKLVLVLVVLVLLYRLLLVLVLLVLILLGLVLLVLVLLVLVLLYRFLLILVLLVLILLGLVLLVLVLLVLVLLFLVLLFLVLLVLALEALVLLILLQLVLVLYYCSDNTDKGGTDLCIGLNGGDTGLVALVLVPLITSRLALMT
jgi:hypothetical protein